MSQVIETTVYTFDELSDAAKESARGWFREASVGDNSFADFTTDALIKACEALGVDVGTHTVRLMGGGSRQAPNVYWSLSYSQGDGASFDGSYTYAKDAKSKLAKHFGGDDLVQLQALAQRLVNVQRRNGYQLSASIEQSGRYTHSGTMAVSVDHGRDHDVKGADEEEIKEVVRELADWFFHALRGAYEWEQADEQVDETIRANEYTFTADGSLF